MSRPLEKKDILRRKRAGVWFSLSIYVTKEIRDQKIFFE